MKAQTTGAALNFGSGSDYVQMSSLSFGNSWTAEAWIKPTNLTGNWNVVLGQCAYTSSLSQGFVIAVQNGSVFVDGPQLGGVSITVGVTSAWTHVAVTYNNGIWAFYKNGIIVGTKAAPFTNSSNPFYLGRRTDNTNSMLIDQYQGDMDEVRIWSVARSECDIQQYMNCEIPSTATGLVANYHFNQGLANNPLNYVFGPFTLTDNTGNGNTGSLNNFNLNASGYSNWISLGSPASGLTTPASAPSAEIDVKGNATSIVDGDLTPSTADYTNFNGAATRTFVVYNTGTQTLNLTTPVFTGPDASQFTVITAPSTVVAATSGTTSFVVAFTPTSLGVKTASINIYNQDCNEQFYKFAITATAVAGASLKFDGVDDYVETNANLAELAQADFVIEAKIKTTGGGMGIVTCANSNGSWDMGEKSLYLDASGIPTFVGWGNGYIFGNIAVNDGNWHHIAVSWDYMGGTSGVPKMFIDGIDQTLSATTYTASNLNVGTFKIGRANYNSVEAPYNFAGEIDEVRIWNRLLCLPELINNLNCELPSPTSQIGLNGYYKFNQGIAFGTNTTVTTAPDAAVFNNTGILTGFGLTGGPTSDWSAPGGVTSGSSCSAYLDPEINIKGNTVNIVTGDITPSAADFTDFGNVPQSSVLSRTFVIQNIGTAALTISSYSVSGPNASNFTITTNPAASIAAAGTSTIVVSFSAAILGAKLATLNISSNDCDEPIYLFAITASCTVPGEALTFDGINDYVSLTDPVFGTSDLTVEAWIKPTIAGGGVIFSTRTFECCGGGSWFTLATSTLGNLSLELGDPAGGAAANYTAIGTSTLLNMGAWNHVAFVRSGLEVDLFVNGILGARFTDYGVRNLQNTGAGVLNLGVWNYPTPAGWYKGAMDEVRLWTVARTQNDLQTYMNCEIPTTASGLIGNYHFTQGSAGLLNAGVNTLTDLSGSNRTGTLNGFTLNGTTSNWTGTGGVTTGSTTINTPTVEIEIRGNGNVIADGTSTTSVNDFTDFNGALTRTFVVLNTVGGGTLNFAPFLTGTNANQFSVTTFPASFVNGISSTSFVVTFIPTTIGLKTATVNLITNDQNEPLYDFVITATAVAGAAMSFDGVNDKASVASGISIYNQSFSFEFWAQRRANGVNGIVAGLGSTIASNQALQIGFRNTDYFTFAFYLNDMNYMGPQTTDGNFHHWACVYDATGVGKNRFIYCDGILVLSDFSASAFLGTGAVVIGDAGYGSNPFNGTVDEFRLWNKALSQCEIQSRMNCEIAGSQPSLTVNYHFNQGIAGGTNTTVISLTDDNASPKNANLSNFSMTGLISNFITPGAVISGNTTQTPPAATLAIEGNGNSISAGSTVPLTSNFTDFGTATTRTLVMKNISTGSLYINSGAFTGANAANFSVTTTPSSVIPASGSSSFVISFTPTALGSQSAILNVYSSDCTNPTYSFVITASTSAASALNFDGTNDYAEANNTAALMLTNVLSVEAWVKPTDNSGVYYIVSKGVGDGVNGQYGLVLINGVPQFHMFNLAHRGATAAYTVTPGVWTHLAGTWDGSVTTIYVNGISYGTSGYTGTMTANTNSLQIGRVQPSGYQNYGSIDELRIWNICRKQCDIQSYMNCEIPTTASGLVANYHFNQGIPSGVNTSVTTLVDAANGNNATLSLFTLNGSSSNWVSPGGVISGSVTPAIPSASILVSGNSTSITPGSTSTSTLNFTDFGSLSTRTFVIQNSATGTLNIAAPYFTGVNASEFSVTTLPSLSLAASATTSFVVAFTPTTGGFRTATLNINNNDCNIPIFSCALGGTAVVASALNFDGADDFIQTPIDADTDVMLNTTWEAWIYPTTTTNYRMIVAIDDNGWDRFLTLNAGYLSIATSNPGEELVTTINANQWYHVAVTYNQTSNQAFTYVNGIQFGPYTTAFASGTTLNNLMIGANTNLGSQIDFFEGKIDEVRIWNTIRTQCDIQSYMNCEIPATAPGLVANYHFNQGAAGLDNTTVTSLSDATGVNTGTLSGFSLLTGTVSNWVTPGGIISGSVTPTVQTASVLITGNSNSITPGATSATTLNLTDFGSATSGTFVIHNSGTGTLNIGTPYITGVSALQFSFVTLPASSLTTSGTTPFEILFTPTSTGVSSATVHVNTNDCTNGDFSFVITATAVTGAALSFDGIDDYVDLGASTTLKPSNAVTAETWAYMSAWSGSATMIGNSQLSGYTIRNNGIDLRGLVHVNGNFLTVSTPLSGISAGWHHIALTFDGRYEYLYLDGVLKSSNDAGATYSITALGNNVLLGAEASSGMYPIGGFFPGKLDEVRIWDRALCQAEIQNNLSCEVSATGNGLVANYHFNEGVAYGHNSTVSSLPDFSGNSLDGTLNDMSRSGATSNWISPGAVTSGSSCGVFTSSEIDLIGNSISIPDGATTPSVSNNTDFGSICSNSISVKTFSIHNTGSAALTVSGFSFTGAGAASFSLGALSPASPIATNSFAVFSVSFMPVSTGVITSTLTITNNDCDEGSYDFVITGTSNAIPTVTASSSNSVVCAGAGITLTGSGADTYTWNPGVQNALSFTPTANQTYTLSGTYTLTGCTNSNLATQSITVNLIPTVTITAVNPILCSGNIATLTASGAGSYTWNPGPVNGGTLTVTPLTSTTYSLVGTSTAGCASSNTATQLITVNTSPTLTATSVNTAICITFSTTLSVSGATTYSWFPGSLSGGTITVSPSSTTNYTAVGYGSTGCVSSNSIILTVTVNSLPVVTTTASNPVICSSGTTSLIGGGADTYTWNPTAVNNQSFTPAFGITAYTVTGSNTLTGCTSTNLAVQSITVDVVPTVSATVTNSIICSGSIATLIASGASTYTWNPGNSSGTNFTVSPGSFTTYTVTGTSSAGCTSTNLAVQSISINSLPTVSAGISNSVICNGTSVTVNASGASTYTWNNGAADGVAFTPSLSGTYSVAGTNSVGCTSTNVAVVSLTVNALPSLSITVSNSVICIGKQTTLNGSGALTYTWSNGITNNVAFSPTATASYTLSGSDVNGCENIAVETVTVNNLPVLSVVSSSSVSCEAQSTTLTANGAASYTWNSNETTAAIVISPSVTSNYTIIAVDANTCTNTLVYTQSVVSCPGIFTASATYTDISCSGKDDGKIVVTASTSYSSPVISYNWSPLSLCSLSDCDTLKHLSAGVYNVTVKITYTLNGLLVKTDSVVLAPIVLKDLNGPCDIKVFTGLSPNGDGLNDVLTIENIEEFPNNNVTVYSRWGVEVFKTKGYNNLDKAFPLKDEIKNLPSNTYFYIVDLGDGSKLVKGWIELIKN